jgi:hypothetical protein
MNAKILSAFETGLITPASAHAPGPIFTPVRFTLAVIERREGTARRCGFYH